MFSMRIVLAVMALLLSFNSFAQTTTYRWTDPVSGNTVFSDFPPPPGMKDVRVETRESSFEPEMSYTTRQAAERHPVTLFSSETCEEFCNTARALLKKRSIPYNEKIIKTKEDYEAAKNELRGEVSIPTIRIGRQTISGFNDSAWNNLLDMAGYPNSTVRSSPPPEQSQQDSQPF